MVVIASNLIGVNLYPQERPASAARVGAFDPGDDRDAQFLSPVPAAGSDAQDRERHGGGDVIRGWEHTNWGLDSQLMDRCRCDLAAQLAWPDGSQLTTSDSPGSRMPCR